MRLIISVRPCANGWLKYIKAAYAAEPGEKALGPSIEQGRVVVEEDN